MLGGSNLLREGFFGIKEGGIIHVVDDPDVSGGGCCGCTSEDALPSGCGVGKVPPAVKAGEP